MTGNMPISTLDRLGRLAGIGPDKASPDHILFEIRHQEGVPLDERGLQRVPVVST